jgi:hypothetical protein
VPARLLRFAVVPFILLVGLSACAQQESADLGPPEGWTAAGDSLWYQPGVDTALAFRDLENLTRMGVMSTEVYAASVGMTPDEILLARALKREMLQLFRNHPEVVDSVFERHVLEAVKSTRTDDPRTVPDDLKRETYRTLQRHFRQPLLTTRLGEDVPYVYPDSLRQRPTDARVRVQVYVSEEGEPLAIRLIDGVDPTLDALAMQMTAQMEWQPAHVRRIQGFIPIASWARNAIVFPAGG